MKHITQKLPIQNFKDYATTGRILIDNLIKQPPKTDKHFLKTLAQTMNDRNVSESLTLADIYLIGNPTLTFTKAEYFDSLQQVKPNTKLSLYPGAENERANLNFLAELYSLSQFSLQQDIIQKTFINTHKSFNLQNSINMTGQKHPDCTIKLQDKTKLLCYDIKHGNAIFKDYSHIHEINNQRGILNNNITITHYLEQINNYLVINLSTQKDAELQLLLYNAQKILKDDYKPYKKLILIQNEFLVIHSKFPSFSPSMLVVRPFIDIEFDIKLQPYLKNNLFTTKETKLQLIRNIIKDKTEAEKKILETCCNHVWTPTYLDVITDV